MNVILVGFSGHMGQEIYKLQDSGKLKVVAGVDVNSPFSKIKIKDGKVEGKKIDCIVDFSFHASAKDVCDFAVKHNIPVVMATTGHDKKELNTIFDASTHVPFFHAANYSIGIAILIKLACQTASIMADADVEIVETHHNRKVDAPSGTAIAIAKSIQEERPGSKLVKGRNGDNKRSSKDIGINSIRIGNVVGEHEVIINNGPESISLKHTAYDRSLFANGALEAAKFLVGKKAGMYTMNDIISSYI